MKEYQIRKITKLLVANRGEIAIRVLRAGAELRIRTVAIYTYEDRYSLHRYKADEAYQIGANDDPLKPYLDIDQIIAVAKENGVDAIHPGYGFLSENAEFAKKCVENGIVFIGPRPDVMERLGDKVAAKEVARAAEVPIIEDSRLPLTNFAVAKAEAERIGLPLMIKAAGGGGGRGMRVVRKLEELEKAFHDAKNEAAKAFNNDHVFFEKFIENPKHIEVQIMGDEYGNMVHLFERDCSVQRRFQKVVEVAPSTLPKEAKDKLFEYALKLCKTVDYNNVGTVEFLVDKDLNIYFIEVNTRIQVEHTITEEVTGVDIVRSQIRIAEGYKLSDSEIFIRDQADVRCDGFAIQCRITTEDPKNGFKPDYGVISAYRNAGGFGIRLDEGSSYPGVKISPFFDSMLVKVSAWGRTLWGASERLRRALIETRIRGVKTNIGFLENVISHPDFQNGKTTVGFIQDNPELFKIQTRQDRSSRVLRYIADLSVNGNPDVKTINPNITFRNPKVPETPKGQEFPRGTKDMLNEMGREKFVDWLKNEKRIQYTDTTFRDAHQSLLATRVRTIDMVRVAEGFAKKHPEMFSMEVWGGATFDVTMRFLHECPWQRLQRIRAKIPNILLQMLFRSSNGVGYKAYPDNLIEKFIEKSWENGMDIFRIFDSLNWVDAMKTSIRTVRENTGGLAEACICYTGEILDPNNKKYTLQYYLDMARRLEDEGAHILAIKDMAGLLKPYSAEILIKSLREHISLPIHLHTHDTSGIQTATYLKAIEAGVNVVDVALASMSGLTSQPNFNSLVAAMKFNERENPMDLNSLNEYSNYWQDVREYYYPFESDMKASTADVYEHEIPGGQYSNLRPQAISLGLGEKFEEIKKNYAAANQLFGDLVKVTPSSKVVGDMALYMTSNNLTAEDILEKGHTLSFPESVKEMFRGELGQPMGGFPEKISKIILKDEIPFTNSANAHLAPIDFDREFKEFQEKFDDEASFLDFISYKFYPKVFEEFYQKRKDFGDIAVLPTPVFFYGIKPGEEVMANIDKGKTIIVRYLFCSEPNEDGIRKVSFELNGVTRVVSVKDRKHKVVKSQNRKISSAKEIGAPLQGKLATILVKAGEEVRENTPLFVIEAMKMQTTITAPAACKIKNVILNKGAMVEQDDAVIEIE